MLAVSDFTTRASRVSDGNFCTVTSKNGSAILIAVVSFLLGMKTESAVNRPTEFISLPVFNTSDDEVGSDSQKKIDFVSSFLQDYFTIVPRSDFCRRHRYSGKLGVGGSGRPTERPND